MKLKYVIPNKDDLWYRKSIIEDKDTMKFNNGIVPFPKEKWDSWYSKWIESDNKDYFYAYLFDEDCQKFVGEIAYRKDPNLNIAILNIIIEHKHRGKGYGKEGLNILVKTAFKNGYSEVCDYINKDSLSSHRLFSNFGFKIISSENNDDIEFRLTKNDYVNLYGTID
ncbi:MAG: GNAT family N-acetyltransferase [Bacilli bacterium]|nr:GNAT family N-acetyltransferase [Bacilli bacterium]